MCLFAWSQLASFFRLRVRRCGRPGTTECVGVLLLQFFAHFQLVRVGGEGETLRGEMVSLLVAVSTQLLLNKKMLAKSVCFGGHGLARRIDGKAGAGSRIGNCGGIFLGS